MHPARLCKLALSGCVIDHPLARRIIAVVLCCQVAAEA
jgi:hypothetical protein